MITWISSYPRSGNTYFRELLKGIYGIESIELPSIPKPVWLRLQIMAWSRARRFIKKHRLPSNDRHPAIYLVRDGRDSLVSFTWFTLQVRQNKETADVDAALFHQTLADLIQKPREAIGDWSSNVRAWSRRANTVVIRYEDLVKAPQEVVAQTPTRLGMKAQPRRDAQLPTFDAMRKKNPKLVRRGIAGSWKDEFPADLLLLFWKHHGEMMRELGYGNDAIQAA